MLQRILTWSLLALVWVVLSDVYTLGSVAAGMLAATVVLRFFAVPLVTLATTVQFGGISRIVLWLGKAIHLLLFFLWKVFLSNVRVARVIFQRKLPQPGIIRMELAGLNPSQITLLSLLIGLTPGTMVVGVTPDYGAIYIHALEATDEAGTLYAPRRFEAFVLEVVPS